MSAIQSPTHFGAGPEGEAISLVTIENGYARASIMSWGASLQDFRLAGVDHSLVLGSPQFTPYLTAMRYFGAIVGRVANRIANGRAPLGGRIFDLDRNENGRTTLHGGSRGSGVRNWTIEGHDAHSCRLTIRLADGECGFPGNLDLTATYRLGEDGALDLEIEGRTDAPTFCNPAHHSYWNLDGTEDLSGHRMIVRADAYLPVDAGKIPLGAPASIVGTRFDFHKWREVVMPGDAPLDHNFWLSDQKVELRPVCVLTAGIRLYISTTEPGLQIYDGAHIKIGDSPTHAGRPYGRHAGLALEPQCPPDAPNQAGYPSILLLPGQVYRQHSRFHVRYAAQKHEGTES